MFTAIFIDSKSMYKFICDALQVQGPQLNSLIYLAMAAIILGAMLLYLWKILVLGLIGIYCLSAFFSHQAVQNVIAINQDNSSSLTQKIIQKNEFMHDCLTIAMNTKDACESIYNEN